jgi:hypothetical protein
MPALLLTAVNPLFSGRLRSASMRVSGTPERPNPPQRMVVLLSISSMAASADGYTLFIVSLELVEENNRASFNVWGRLAILQRITRDHFGL